MVRQGTVRPLLQADCSDNGGIEVSGVRQRPFSEVEESSLVVPIVSSLHLEA
jgi:hypothetical protein